MTFFDVPLSSILPHNHDTVGDVELTLSGTRLMLRGKNRTFLYDI